MMTARVCGVVVAACLIGCGGGGNDDRTGTGPGGGGGGGGGGTTAGAVDVRDNSFNPSTTTVAPGARVVWTWRGTQQHDVVFADGARSERQTTGSYERTFASAGTFEYSCSVHGVSMSGNVVVR